MGECLCGNLVSGGSSMGSWKVVCFLSFCPLLDVSSMFSDEPCLWLTMIALCL